MGRYDNKKASTTKTVESDEKVTETTEGTAMTEDIFDDTFNEDADVSVEADADTDEGNEDAPVEAAAETAPEPDISNFVALISSLISRGDDGEVIELTAEDTLNVQNAYKVLTRKEKNLAKNAMSSAMEDAVMKDDDISLAKFYLEVNNRMSEAPKVAKESKEKKVVDPSEAIVRLIAKLDLARALVVVPEGMDKADIEKRASDLFNAGVEDVKKDEPELVWVKQALNLSSPKKVKAVTDGVRTRHSVSNHIAEAFANAKSGEKLTLAQIVDFKSDEYGDERPSKQAVMAHLQSKKFLAATELSVDTGEKGEPVLVKK